MTRAAKESGPWGEALQYWLVQRNLSQADLVRLMNKHEKRSKRVQPNSISRVVRGFHTQTAFLARIATVLEIPLIDLLVSPERRLGDQKKLRQAIEMGFLMLQDVDRRPTPTGGITPEQQQLAEAMARQIQTATAPTTQPLAKPIVRKK